MSWCVWVALAMVMVVVVPTSESPHSCVSSAFTACRILVISSSFHFLSCHMSRKDGFGGHAHTGKRGGRGRAWGCCLQHSCLWRFVSLSPLLTWVGNALSLHSADAVMVFAMCVWGPGIEYLCSILDNLFSPCLY